MTIAVTETAAHLLTEQLRRSLLPAGAGLRIWGTYDDEEDQLMMTCGFVEGPTLADEVIEEHAARIFVDRDIAPHLADKTITVRRENDGVALVVIDEGWADGDSFLS